LSLFDELKHRNVIRVGIAYLAAAWLIIQIGETLLPVYGFSDVAIRNMVAILMVGLLPALILAWVFKWTSQGLAKDTKFDRGQAVTHTGNRRLDLMIVVVLVLAVTYFAIDKFVLDPTRDTQEIQAAVDQARSDAAIESYGDKSIAVLAFDDMSPLGDQEYFSDGIAEELLNLLATIKELRVISRSTAFSFKGSSLTLKEIAGKLEVTYILEGSVRKAGNKLRITAQLIDARADAHVWSQTYDRTMDDVFAIQDEISAQVVEQLKLTLFGEMPTATQVDPRAFDLYLQARHIVDKEKLGQIKEAQTMLDRALEIEPDYLAAIIELQRVYYRLMKTGAKTEDEFEAYARQSVIRLEEIKPNSIEVLFQKGWTTWEFDHDLQLAAHYFEQAMAMDPTHLELLRWIVMLLTKLDRADEAIEIGNYLVLNDPSCEACFWSLFKAYRQAGDRPEEAALAIEEFLKWRTGPVPVYLGWSLGVSWLVDGYPDKALEAFKMIEQSSSGKFGKIFALHDLGRIDEFETQFAVLRNNPEESPESIARVYAWTANNDKAFEWLDKAIEIKGADIIGYIDTELYEKIKPDPRWQALREKYGYDETTEEIEFNITLPPGVTID